jgi:hypothetical protein
MQTAARNTRAYISLFLMTFSASVIVAADR